MRSADLDNLSATIGAVGNSHDHDVAIWDADRVSVKLATHRRMVNLLSMIS